MHNYKQSSKERAVNYTGQNIDFLPVSYLIDIRTTKFLENVVRNDNCVCRLVAHNAQCSLDKIFLLYGDDISSSCDLRHFITDMLFE